MAKTASIVWSGEVPGVLVAGLQEVVVVHERRYSSALPPLSALVLPAVAGTMPLLGEDWYQREWHLAAVGPRASRFLGLDWHSSVVPSLKLVCCDPEAGTSIWHESDEDSQAHVIELDHSTGELAIRATLPGNDYFGWELSMATRGVLMATSRNYSALIEYASGAVVSYWPPPGLNRFSVAAAVAGPQAVTVLTEERHRVERWRYDGTRLWSTEIARIFIEVLGGGVAEPAMLQPHALEVDRAGWTWVYNCRAGLCVLDEAGGVLATARSADLPTLPGVTLRECFQRFHGVDATGAAWFSAGAQHWATRLAAVDEAWLAPQFDRPDARTGLEPTL